VSALTFRALLLCLLAPAVGCSKAAPQAVEKMATPPTPAPRPSIASKEAPQAVEKVEAVEEKPKPQARATVDDFEILDAVLLDVVDLEDLKSAVPTKFVFVLDTMTAGGPYLTSQGHLNGGPRNKEANPVSEELGDDLRRRNPGKPISLAGYKSPSPKILVERLGARFPAEDNSEEAANSRRFPIRLPPYVSHYIIAALPGYSKDGNTAVLTAHLGPGIHGDTLTYKLARKDGRWVVVWGYVSRPM
jgi:hypothetical protein